MAALPRAACFRSCRRPALVAGRALLFFTFALLVCGQLHADVVYLALGDSLTFGYDPSTPASLVPSLDLQPAYARAYAA